jgi:hypothetical protein
MGKHTTALAAKAPSRPKRRARTDKSVAAMFLAALTFGSKVEALFAAGYEPRELGRLTKINSTRVVRDWATGSTPRKKAVPERIDDLCAIVTHLIKTTGYQTEDIVGWTRSRNSELGWRTPLEALSDPEEFERVLAAAEHLGRPPAEVLEELERTRGVAVSGRGLR